VIKPNASSDLRLRKFHSTQLGKIYLGDSLRLFLEKIKPHSVDLIMTSPPFGLVRKKDYGNVDSHDYVEWFKPFGEAFHKALKPHGSLVIDIGGAWISGQPTRSLYHYELLISLCRDFGFHLAQEFFWWNPARLPTPAEWVTVRRVRVKDAVNCVWWLSPTPWPKASNRRVLQPYSESMKQLLTNGYKAKKRPSGHDISKKFSWDNGAAIPPNLLAIAHTESNSAYIRYCAERELKPHPARFPVDLPAYFIHMLTDPNDLVVDPFAGSCVTGEAAERIQRRWICCESVPEYVEGALGRFQPKLHRYSESKSLKQREESYRISKPCLAQNGEKLSQDGGRKRPPKINRTSPQETPRPASVVQLRLLDEDSARTRRSRRLKY